MQLKKIATYCPKSARMKYNGCDFWNEIPVFCLTQKVKVKIAAHSSMPLL